MQLPIDPFNPAVHYDVPAPPPGRADLADPALAPALVLTVAYDGAHFAGYARQPDQVTVQGVLESALGTLLHRPVPIVGAGRTDSGVHAYGQVVSIALDPGEYPADVARFTRSLNALVGEHLRIRGVRAARHGFSARFDATSRLYRYLVATGPSSPLFARGFAHYVPATLDVAAMRAGAAHLIGEHDFRSFCVTSSAREMTTVRTLDTVDVAAVDTAAMLFDEPLISFTVRGNAFLHSMVRSIVGTLLEVGDGSRTPESVADILAACDRNVAGRTAPARGLAFMSVSYPNDVWI